MAEFQKDNLGRLKLRPLAVGMELGLGTWSIGNRISWSSGLFWIWKGEARRRAHSDLGKGEDEDRQEGL